MRLDADAVMLRIYLGERDSVGGRPAYKRIVEWLRAKGVWGATVLRGVYGYGRKSVLHAATPLRLSVDLPIIIEVVESRRKIEPLLDELSAMVKEGLVTIEDVRVVRHVGGDEPATGPNP